MADDKKLSNYLPLNRKFFEHEMWEMRRVYSMAEAWLWLIANARFDEKKATAVIDGKVITWGYGEVPASLRYLGKAWQWDKNKVDRFLSKLIKDDMITTRKMHGQNIVKLNNYEAFNRGTKKPGHKAGQQAGQQNVEPALFSADERDSNGTANGTLEGQRRDKTNIGNIGKEDLYTAEQKTRFEKFTTWISKHAPSVAKMREPFTIEQFLSLQEKLTTEQVTELLQRMDNYLPLLQKNKSAYKTILNWSRRDTAPVEAGKPHLSKEAQALANAGK